MKTAEIASATCVAPAAGSILMPTRLDACLRRHPVASSWSRVYVCNSGRRNKFVLYIRPLRAVRVWLVCSMVRLYYPRYHILAWFVYHYSTHSRIFVEGEFSMQKRTVVGLPWLHPRCYGNQHKCTYLLTYLLTHSLTYYLHASEKRVQSTIRSSTIRYAFNPFITWPFGSKDYQSLMPSGYIVSKACSGSIHK